MEQQNKYYTPDLSELHIGYELETLHKINNEKVWKTDIIENGNGIDDVWQHCENIRTKYLAQQDIEGLGWKFIEGQRIADNKQDYFKSNLLLKYFPRHHSLFIVKPIDPNKMDGFAEKLFDGACKSINELKTIMRFLKIPTNNE